MKRLLGLVLVLVFFSSNVFSAGPQAFGKKGSATTSNVTVTVPFHPVMVCFSNDDATNGLYIDWTDGIATTGDESSNFYLAPGDSECYTFVSNIAPGRSFLVGVLASAGTTAYHFNASRAN